MIKRVFIRGLLVLTPIILTIEVIVWLFTTVENLVGGFYIRLIGEQYYFPGLGVLIAIIIIFLVGILINYWIVRKTYELIEKLIYKLPFIKILCRSVADLMRFFKGNSKMEDSRVVMVPFQGMKMMGLVSRNSFEDLPKGIGEEGDVVVYIPLSYQIGGVTVVLPKSMVQPIEMGVEEAIRFTVTAGMPGKSTDAIESTDEEKTGEAKK